MASASRSANVTDRDLSAPVACRRRPLARPANLRAHDVGEPEPLGRRRRAERHDLPSVRVAEVSAGVAMPAIYAGPNTTRQAGRCSFSICVPQQQVNAVICRIFAGSPTCRTRISQVQFEQT